MNVCFSGAIRNLSLVRLFTQVCCLRSSAGQHVSSSQTAVSREPLIAYLLCALCIIAILLEDSKDDQVLVSRLSAQRVIARSDGHCFIPSNRTVNNGKVYKRDLSNNRLNLGASEISMRKSFATPQEKATMLVVSTRWSGTIPASWHLAVSFLLSST